MSAYLPICGGSESKFLASAEMSPPKSHPRFVDLPLNPSDPPHSAWGLYGADDELGTLNLLTPERKQEAAKEIQTGVSVGLNWPLHFMDHTGGFRHTTEHKIVELSPNINVRAYQELDSCSVHTDP